MQNVKCFHFSWIVQTPNNHKKKTNKMKWKQNIFEGGRKIVHTEDWRLNGTLIIIKEYYLLDVSFNKTVINVWLCCHRKYNTIIKENKENEKRFSHAKHRNWTWKKICKWLRRFSIRSVCDYCILYTSIANEMDKKKSFHLCYLYQFKSPYTTDKDNWEKKSENLQHQVNSIYT